MLHLNKIYTYILANKLIAGALVLVVLGGGWWYTTKSETEAVTTFTVERGDFVRDISVSGKVVASQSVDLGFSQGGRVTRVNARVGSRVGAGTVLAEVENGDLRANVLQREAALDVQKAKLASLQAGTRPEEIAVAESNVRRDTIALERAAQSVVDAIRDAETASENAVYNTLEPLYDNPRSYSPDFIVRSLDNNAEISAENERVSVGVMLEAWAEDTAMLTVADGTSAKVIEAQKNVRDVLNLLSYVNAALNRAIVNVDTTQSEIDAYIADVAADRATLNTKNAALTASLTSLRSAEASLEASEKNLALKKAGTVQADINAQEAQVKAAEADLINARAQLAKTLLTAPFSGVITVMDAKVGKIVSSNSPEISMVSTNTYQIESFVPEINVALIAVGDSAEVSLDAYGAEEKFAASVVSIDPAETIKDGVATYRAVLQFKTQDQRIKPGMTANVVITTERKENVFSIPEGAVIERDGKHYVTLLDGDVQKEIEVTIGGISSMGTVEVITGLREGDQVVLDTPAE